MTHRYTRKDLLEWIEDWRESGIVTLDGYGKFDRGVRRIAHNLQAKVSEGEVERAYLSAFTGLVREKIDCRMTLKYPDHDPEDAYTLDALRECAEYVLTNPRAPTLRILGLQPREPPRLLRYGVHERARVKGEQKLKECGGRGDYMRREGTRPSQQQVESYGGGVGHPPATDTCPGRYPVTARTRDLVPRAGPQDIQRQVPPPAFKRSEKRVGWGREEEVRGAAEKGVGRARE